jgi:Tfp pilus assembly protein PilV
LRRLRGFSLLESLVSLFLLILALLFLLNLMPSSLVATRAVECELSASSLADQALEDARASGFPQLVVGTRNLPD